ncbi:Uncharacterised protein [Mycobacteroides abscessus subsp. abscessus]|nr:Uncharacterised protein [Mycobacteroides abscessus subsp. abscessus]SIL34201.1 Uncharacterised protein [Mycobacteroides abscessus subsp. abscessus]
MFEFRASRLGCLNVFRRLKSRLILRLQGDATIVRDVEHLLHRRVVYAFEKFIAQ